MLITTDNSIIYSVHVSVLNETRSSIWQQPRLVSFLCICLLGLWERLFSTSTYCIIIYLFFLDLLEIGILWLYPWLDVVSSLVWFWSVLCISGQQTAKTVAIVLGGALALGFLVICLLFARSLVKKKDGESYSTMDRPHFIWPVFTVQFAAAIAPNLLLVNNILIKPVCLLADYWPGSMEGGAR